MSLLSGRQTNKLSSSRRTRYEIWSEILEACAWAARTQSWLMRKLGLKTSAMKDALAFLVSAQLLIKQDEPEPIQYLYKTSEKGKSALQRYYELITEYFSN